MAKPIFIVEAPIMEEDELDNLGKLLKKELTDYHVLIVNSDVDEYNFEVFYEKDFTEINFNDLRKLIKDKLKLCI